MAEGVDPVARVPEVAFEEEEESAVAQVDPQAPVVRPKGLPQGHGGGDSIPPTATPGAVPTPPGESWDSPVLSPEGGERQNQPVDLSSESFRRWRERRWVEDEEGDWSYSTGLGTSTMDIIKEKYGEFSFRDASSWQPWAPGEEQGSSWRGPPSTTERRFRLASPKLRLGSRPERPVRRADGARGAPRGGPGEDPDQGSRGWRGTLGQGLRDTSTTQSTGAPESRRDRALEQGLPGRPGYVGAPGGWPPQGMWGPPPLQATFDGSPDRLAIFLCQVISYVDLYGHLYPSQWAIVVAITTGLRGEAADWAADLHSDHARELVDVGLFLEGLRARFEDESRVQQAEGELVSLRQRGRPAKEYVRDFRSLAGRLRGWPERMLVHQFHLGLDRELRQACVYRGLPPRLSEWFKAAIDLDIGLKEFRGRGFTGPAYVGRTPERAPPPPLGIPGRPGRWDDRGRPRTPRKVAVGPRSGVFGAIKPAIE